MPDKKDPEPTGRTDLHNFTFGGGGIGATREMVERSIAEGTSTGFRQLKGKYKPFRRGKYVPPVEPAAPKPDPPPAPPED